MVKKVVFILLAFAMLFSSCSVKKKCSEDLSKVYLKESKLKVKGTVYINSIPALFLLKKENTKETLKLFTPFGKKVGEFKKDKSVVKFSVKDFEISSRYTEFIEKLPLSLSELLSGKIYREKIEKIYCTEDGFTVIEKKDAKIYIKNGKIRKILWKTFKADYTYDGFKVSKITIYNKEKKQAVIYIK